MALLAGALLIHCVVEDAFWLLNGLVNGVLKDYWGAERWKLERDSRVFEAVLGGSEPKVSKLFKDVGINGGFVFLLFLSPPLRVRCRSGSRILDASVGISRIGGLGYLGVAMY